MSTKEAKRYRKLMRSSIELGTRAKFDVMVEKARHTLRIRAILIGAIIALTPANVYAAFLILKEFVK